MGGQVGSAPDCYSSSALGSNPDISQKYKMGDISKGVGHHTLARQKNIQKNVASIEECVILFFDQKLVINTFCVF
jgi:hypothetical protein